MIWMMVFIFILVVYSFLAWGFVKIVKKLTSNNRIYKRLAIALVILLPTWDSILSLIFYYPACYFIPKTVIYETAKTDGIYYEGDYKNYIYELENKGPQVAHAGDDLEKGYNYLESLVNRKHKSDGIYSMTPTIYRCVPFPDDPLKRSRYLASQCVRVEKAQSKYMVTVRKIKLGLTEINFMKIINRSTGKLMAEYNEVIAGDKDNFISFLDLTRISSGGGSLTCCQEKTRLYDFQYDVLKLKQQPIEGGK